MSADSEQAIALYEAERNRAWHSWFAARGHIPPTDESTLIFDGGFRMAWELCRAQPAPQPAEQQPDVAQLVEALECMIIGACAVAVPHNGERAVLQDAVNLARAALAAYRKQGGGA